MSRQLGPGISSNKNGVNTVKTVRFSHGLSIQSDFGKENVFGMFKCHGIIQSNKAEFQGLSFQKTAERHEEIKALRVLFPQFVT